jgi:CHAT domain-containing protein
LKQGSASTALDIIEASKARTFLALVQQRGWKLGRNQDDPFVAGLIARERQLRNDIASLRQRVAVQTPKELGAPLRGGNALAAISAAALDELNALCHAYESIVIQLQLAAPGLAGVSAPAPFALDAFRAAANRAYNADWVALDYLRLDDQIVCAVISPRDVRLEHKKLSSYDQDILEQCAATEPDLRELIYRGTLHGERVSSVGAEYLRHLYPLLIPQQLDANKLIVSPHGALHNLPFHALVDPQNNSFLVEHCAIVYTPSLHAMQHLLAQADKNRSRDALVFGLSDFGETMRALPETEKEVNALRKLFPDGRFFWGAQASRQKLYDFNASGELERFALLHFATHATLKRAAPHQSRIMLSDLPLTVFDILDLTLDARLVTLSACQTALGKGGQGDELVGLARAFFYAGARVARDALACGGWFEHRVDPAILQTLGAETKSGRRPASRANRDDSGRLSAVSMGGNRDFGGRHEKTARGLFNLSPGSCRGPYNLLRALLLSTSDCRKSPCVSS